MYEAVDCRNRVSKMKSRTDLAPEQRYIYAYVLDIKKNPPRSLLWICSLKRNDQSHIRLKGKFGDLLHLLDRFKKDSAWNEEAKISQSKMAEYIHKNINTLKMYYAILNNYPREVIDLIIKNARERVNVFTRSTAYFSDKVFKSLSKHSLICLFKWIYVQTHFLNDV